MIIIGTAGHIDHGKSSLVHALTSMDPDRLPEEKKRGMTIDLGFAWLPLSNGEFAGIIDVPGHKDLMKNVLAGLCGINAVILVVAAYDGWMPQTEEHMRILKFLQVRHGIVVMTKVDLISDPDWLDLVEEDIRKRLKTTFLNDSPILRISVKEGSNIHRLRRCIEDLAIRTPGQRDIGKPRLYVDRVFTITGSGTVVTGTLADGSLSKGQKVVIFPRNLNSSIRSLESYKKRISHGRPGSRIALNLVGIEKGYLERGDIVSASEELVRPSNRIDVIIRLVHTLHKPLKNGDGLMVYMGTREISARITCLQTKILRAGESTLAQLRFKDPVATRIGDHFVIRRPSPSETVGGGTVLDPFAIRFRTKEREKIVAFLQRRADLDIIGLILSELSRKHFIKRDDFLVSSPYTDTELEACVRDLAKEDRLVLAGSWAIDLAFWQRQINKFLILLVEEHARNPLEIGMDLAQLQKYLRLPKDIFDHLITAISEMGEISIERHFVSIRTHKPTLSAEQKLVVSKIMKMFKEQVENPPSKRELSQLIPGSEELVRFMCRQKMLVEVDEDILFDNTHYQRIKNKIIDVLGQKGRISIQETRNLFGLSRKYILPLMKKLDNEGITTQEGSERVLAQTCQNI